MMASYSFTVLVRVQKNPILKEPNPLFFYFIGVFGYFYLSKQLGSLLVDLAHQLSFRLSKNSQILYLSFKHKEIFNYY